MTQAATPLQVQARCDASFMHAIGCPHVAAARASMHVTAAACTAAVLMQALLLTSKRRALHAAPAAPTQLA